MPNREKAEKWARDFKTYVYELDITRDDYRGIMEYIDNAIAILREQEAVKPNTSCDGLPGEGGTWWYVCGNCSKEIDPDDAYCRHCGRKVEWE